MAPKNFNHPALVKSMADSMVTAWPEIRAHHSQMTADGVAEPSQERCFYAGITWCIEFGTNLARVNVDPKNAPHIQAAMHEASSKLARAGADAPTDHEGALGKFDAHELVVTEKDGETYYVIGLGAADSPHDTVTVRLEGAVKLAKAILFDANRRLHPRKP